MPLDLARLEALASSSSIDVPLDIVLVQDETGSFSDDLPELQALAPQIWDSVGAIAHAGFRMSVVGFRDFAQSDWGDSGDWVYRLVSDFTTNRDEFATAINALTADGGNDTPEGQYAALDYLVVPNHPCIDSDGNGSCSDPNDTPVGQEPHFRSGAQKVILLTTDADFHSPANTPGYPGPSRDTVVSDVLAARAIVIGLVPGGAGAIPEVDDLAQVTGGSVQDTGTSGEQVAEAIIAALGGIKPVSADLSTIAVSPASAPADGRTPVAITVTLSDTDGNPVSGKQVLVYTSRGIVDSVTQPCCRTGSSGTAVATLVSSLSGNSVVHAVDVSDNITLTQGVTVEFSAGTPPGAPLTSAIDTLHFNTKLALDNLATVAPNIADTGDSFAAAIGPDEVSGILDAVVNGVSLGLASAAVQAGKPVADLTISGLVDSKVATPLLEAGEGRLFNVAISVGIDGEAVSAVAKSALLDGLDQYAAELAGDSVETVVDDGVANVLGPLLKSTDSLASLAGAFTSDVSTWESTLNDAYTGTESGIPSISPSTQQLYVTDLTLRSWVPSVLNTEVGQEQSLLSVMWSAKESEESDAWLLLFAKVGMDVGATIALDGPGAVGAAAASTAIDAWIDVATVKDDGWGYQIGLGTMNGLVDAERTVVANELSGYSRILNSLYPQTTVGQVVSVTDISAGGYILALWWNELTSYSDVQVRNTSADPITYLVIARYGGDAWLYGIENRYLPLVSQAAATGVPPSQTATVRVYYKNQYQSGLSPKGGSDITFDVLATNEKGTFYVGSTLETWNPTRQESSAAIASIGTRMATRSATAAVTNAVTIDNPVFVSVSSLSGGVYEARIFISNPFAGPIDVQLTQPLPSGITVLATDGNNTGSAITWTKHVEAADITSVSAQFVPSTTINGRPVWLPGTMTFVEPTSGTAVRLQSNMPQSAITTLPLTINSLKLQAKFKKAGSDTCTIKGTLTNLPTGFVIANAAVTLDVGDSTVAFQLNPKGSAANKNGNIKFSRNKRTGTWTFAGTLKGDLKGPWATYGVTSGTAINSDVSFPVLLTVHSGTPEIFAAELPLSYNNKSGTSGTATYLP
ncbi:MAG: Ig-like domain-containing protein [Verrucomicrobiia bacterium]